VSNIHIHEFTVPESAMDVNRHVNNQEYLRWMQDVAIAHSEARGWTLERYRKEGAVWVVRSHFIEYLRPAFAGDDMRIATWVAELRSRSSRRKYLFWRADDGQVIASAETLWVLVSLDTGRACPLSEELRASFSVVSDEAEVLDRLRATVCGAGPGAASPAAGTEVLDALPADASAEGRPFMDAMTTGVLVVAGAGLLAWLLRGGSRGDETVDRGPVSGEPPAAAPADEPDAATAAGPEPEWAEAAAGDEVAVITSDGWMFMPFESGVQIWAPAAADEETGDVRVHGELRVRPAGGLSAGDLITARVAPGEPGEPPWRVEALGRDREYSSWGFEAEAAARDVCALLERVVVKVPVGPDGEPEPVSDEEIAEARRVVEETIRELAQPLEDGPPGEPA